MVPMTNGPVCMCERVGYGRGGSRLRVVDRHLPTSERILFLYYESIKRDPKTRPRNGCRCDERLKTKAEKSTRLAYTGLHEELEHLKIKTRLIDEKLASVIFYFFSVIL